MTLGDVPLGVPVTIASLGGERAFRRRMMEFGLLPGTRVEVLRVAPLGDPLELRVRGCFLSIRRADAQSVVVSEERAPRSAPSSSPALSIQPSLPASS